MTMTRSERARLEAREAELVAEIESRKSASEKAADRILSPAEPEPAGDENEHDERPSRRIQSTPSEIAAARILRSRS